MPAKRRAVAGVAAVATDQAAGTVTIALTGDLDITIVPSLAEHLGHVIGSEARLVIFDMTQVSFADCAAARLICGQDPALALGERPVICHSAPLFRTILTLTGLDASCQLED